MATGSESGLIYVKLNNTAIGNVAMVDREPVWSLTGNGNINSEAAANTIWSSVTSQGNLNLEFNFTVELLESANIYSTIELYDEVIRLNNLYFGQEVELTLEQTVPTHGERTGTYTVICGAFTVAEFIDSTAAYVEVTFHYTESGMNLIEQIKNNDAIVPHKTAGPQQAAGWITQYWGATIGAPDAWTRIYLGDGTYGLLIYGTVVSLTISSPGADKKSLATTDDILIANVLIETKDYEPDYDAAAATADDPDYQQQVKVEIYTLEGEVEEVQGYDTFGLTLSKSSTNKLVTSCYFTAATTYHIRIEPTSSQFSFVIKKVWFTTRKADG